MSSSFVTPWTVACQSSLSMGFPKQGYGVGCHFLLQCVCVCVYIYSVFVCVWIYVYVDVCEVKWSESHSVVSDSLWPHGL